MTDRPGPDAWLFDVWSRFYDAPWVQRLTYRPPQDAVLRELRESRRRRVLDVGCGTGLLTRRLRSELALELCVGCDFSRGMLGRAARNAPELALVRADAARLPFREGRFDAVVSTEAFHWFPDPGAALAEFFRVLAPGGQLLIAFVNPRAEWLSRVTRLGSRALGEPLDWPTHRRMRRRVERAGFRVEAQRAVFRLPAPFLLPCILTVATRPDRDGAPAAPLSPRR